MNDQTEITAPDLSQWIQQHQATIPADYRLIDVREPDEYEICHLEGAELIPLSQFAELATTKLAQKDQTIVVYCHHGMRSQRAQMWLRQQGYQHVVNLTGGIDAWAESVDPAMPRY